MSDTDAPIQPSEPENLTAGAPKRKRNFGFSLAGCGCLFAFSPIILAFLFVYTVCGGNGNESSCGAVGLVFLTPFTVIIGTLIFIVGMVLGAREANKKRLVVEGEDPKPGDH